MAKFITRQRQESGIALGGIGTGSIELRPEGEFYEWQITNVEKFSEDCRERPNADTGERLAGSLSFYVRAQEEGKSVLLRRLGMGLGSGQGTEEYNYRMYSFVKPVEEIEYEGAFPVARLAYRDQALPVNIRLKAAAPFIPGDERAAGTPGAYLTFEVENITDRPVEVALAGKLRNLVYAGPGGNSVQEDLLRNEGYTTVCIKSDIEETASMDRLPTDKGSIALSLEGEEAEISSLIGDYRGYMNEYVAHGSLGISEESFLFGLRRTGGLSGQLMAHRPDWSEELERIQTLTAQEVDELLEKLEGLGMTASILERLRLADAALFENEEGRRSVAAYVLDNWKERDEKDVWGDAALCRSLILQPGEQKQVRFVLAWYFPNLYSEGGSRVGHMYENWFTDAVEAADYLIKEQARILPAAETLSRRIYDTTFPEAFVDAVSTNLSTLVKCSWWSAAGEFGVWEGLGSCGFHTMDITYHGSFGLINLFPALQMRQMRMGAAFQNENGRIPHFFTPDFGSVDDGFDRVDMNPQFVLTVCRDYLVTGDLAYVKELWENIVRAMDSTLLLDADGDGLPDTDTGSNTYDAWRFSGASTYISVLWLGALKAAACLAKALGEHSLENKWLELLETGTRSVEDKLWNGEYYDLWIDGDRRDECCMTDQLDGEYFCRLIGLGGILNPERVKKTLEAVWCYSYTEENGLVNAGFPEGRSATLYTYRNCQGLANWSGIEYAMAAFYLLTGDYEKGEKLVHTVQERHERVGQVWNHAECGDHYYRPLSSWGLLYGLGSPFVDKARRALYLGDGTTAAGFAANPKVNWFGPGVCGRIWSEKGTAESPSIKRAIWCSEGEMLLEALRFAGDVQIAELRLDGEKVSYTKGADGSITVFCFEPVIFREGSMLEICFAGK